MLVTTSKIRSLLSLALLTRTALSSIDPNLGYCPVRPGELLSGTYRTAGRMGGGGGGGGGNELSLHVETSGDAQFAKLSTVVGSTRREMSQALPLNWLFFSENLNTYFGTVLGQVALHGCFGFVLQGMDRFRLVLEAQNKFGFKLQNIVFCVTDKGLVSLEQERDTALFTKACPMRELKEPGGVQGGTMPVATGPGGVQGGTMPVATGPGGVQGGTMPVATGPGGLPAGMMPVVTGPGGVPAGMMPVVTGPGGVQGGTMPVATGPGGVQGVTMPVATGSGGVQGGTMHVATGPGGVQGRTMPVATGPGGARGGTMPVATELNRSKRALEATRRSPAEAAGQDGITRSAGSLKRQAPMPVASAPPPTKVANVESFVPDGAFMAEQPDATKWTAISLNIRTDFATAERLGELTLYPVADERIIFPTVRLVQTQFLGLSCLMFKEAVGGPDLQQLFITQFYRVVKIMDCLKAYTNSMRVCGTGAEGYVTLGFSGVWGVRGATGTTERGPPSSREATSSATGPDGYVPVRPSELLSGTYRTTSGDIQLARLSATVNSSDVGLTAMSPLRRKALTHPNSGELWGVAVYACFDFLMETEIDAFLLNFEARMELGFALDDIFFCWTDKGLVSVEKDAITKFFSKIHIMPIVVLNEPQGETGSAETVMAHPDGSAERPVEVAEEPQTSVEAEITRSAAETRKRRASASTSEPLEEPPTKIVSVQPSVPLDGQFKAIKLDRTKWTAIDLRVYTDSSTPGRSCNLTLTSVTGDVIPFPTAQLLPTKYERAPCFVMGPSVENSWNFNLQVARVQWVLNYTSILPNSFCICGKPGGDFSTPYLICQGVKRRGERNGLKYLGKLQHVDIS
ncbi:hypothetical protein FOZ61_005964 [Perkinsus olseni]|uniref:Uncharacterized protein n=1 Tax=Perkinsus olseni TaxID=32597 RepID=A0A7J6MCH3_PEROL|nr:hypothetical protein FOZ61_005964 [Perkinsus olseni]KAF4674433.1 hypothetical protein FOL46_004995 [Perkinsus olseni]